MSSERDPRRAYRVVDDFEDELCYYTGAPLAVAVDSCTNALFLALTFERSLYDHAPIMLDSVQLPRRTYIGVLQAVLNAGYEVTLWDDSKWQQTGHYRIFPTRVVDSARCLHRGMYKPRTLTCLSFHAAKQLPIGRGGAILLDDEEAAAWLRRARHDGRAEGDYAVPATFPGFHCALPPPDAARGLWMLSRFPDHPPPLAHDAYPDLSGLVGSSSTTSGY
jgi:dTDP-4-amino-4,6-dideoxygalactose transaminase